MPVEPLDEQVITAWAGQTPSLASPSSTLVRIVNISGTARKAATVASGLSALGYNVTGTSTGSVPATTTETVINYHPGSVDQALGLLDHLAGAMTVHPDPTVADGNITLDVGSVVTVSGPTAAPTTPAAGAPTTTAASPSTSIPTPMHQAPSSAQDQPQPYDPMACA